MADFDWSKEKESIVVRSVEAVAVYSNPNGDLVIRQQGGPLDEDDIWVVIPLERVDAVIDAMKDAAVEVRAETEKI
jgi:hypothetical protein